MQERGRFNEGGSFPATHLGDLGKNVREVVVNVAGNHADDVRVQKPTVEEGAQRYLP